MFRVAMISVLIALCFGFSQLIEESTKSIIESKSIIEKSIHKGSDWLQEEKRVVWKTVGGYSELFKT